MPIQLCQTHQLPQDVICGEGECLQRFCSECFLQHNQEHNFGVTLNERSKSSLIQWNQFLLQRFRQIQSNIKSKGISTIFEMKLVPSYPKGLMNQINNTEISEIGLKVINQYLEQLVANVEFISTRATLDELDLAELLKDMYGFFVYDAGRSLNFLAERVQTDLKQKFPQKKMYDYVNFSFVPKEFRVIQNQRKKIVKAAEADVIIQVRKDVKMSSPILSRSKISEKDKIGSPFVRTGAYSPRKELLSRKNNDESSNNGSSLNNSRTHKVFQKTQSPIKVEAIEKTGTTIQQIETQPATIEKQEEIVNVQFEKEPSFVIENEQKFTKLEDVKQSAVLPDKNEIIIPERVEPTQPQKVETALPQKNQTDLQQKVEATSSEKIQTNLPEKVETNICTTPSEVSVLQQIKTEPELQVPNQQLQQLLAKNAELSSKIEVLEGKVNQKERSIMQLNKLISNQEEQLLYRENEVQILTEEIRKLMSFKEKYEEVSKELKHYKEELKFKQKSIAQLNKLIGNEEEEIQFRETEVETLTVEIKKLVQWKQRCEEIEAKLNQKEKQLDEREKGIKELNNVIGNEEEELAFRESEVEVLTSELKKAQDGKLESDRKIDQLVSTNEALQIQNEQLQNVVKILQTEMFKMSNQKEEQTFDEQLMEEVIELESQVVSRNEDIRTLSLVLNKFQKYIPKEMFSETINTLKNLKNVKLEF